MQTWPASLELDRIGCLSAVAVARSYTLLASASGDPDSIRNANARSRVAFRDCQRLCLSAGAFRPASGRWSSRLRAVVDLIDQSAGAGVDLLGCPRCGSMSSASLLELSGLLADLQFYLMRLVA